jgi:hypothetical protein
MSVYGWLNRRVGILALALWACAMAGCGPRGHEDDRPVRARTDAGRPRWDRPNALHRLRIPSTYGQTLHNGVTQDPAATPREEALRWASDYVRAWERGHRRTKSDRVSVDGGPEIELPKAPESPSPNSPIRELLTSLAWASSRGLAEALGAADTPVLLCFEEDDSPFGDMPSDVLRLAIAEGMKAHRVRCIAGSAEDLAEVIAASATDARPPVVVLIHVAVPGGRDAGPSTTPAARRATFTTTFSRMVLPARMKRRLLTITQQVEWRPSGEATVSPPAIAPGTATSQPAATRPSSNAEPERGGGRDGAQARV